MRKSMFLCGRALATGVVLVVALVLSGCGKSAGSAAAEGQKAFQSAPKEVKAEWDRAISAIKANDYATALITFRDLQSQTNLTQEQMDAVGKTATAISDQMYAKANKGDAKANEAIETLRKAMTR
jgi:Sec-independent protein translocase protein TatA